MATANSTTTRITRAPMGEPHDKAESINLSKINPILVTAPGALDGTAATVGAVLSFLALSLRNLDPDGELVFETKPAYGLSLILSACDAALAQAAMQEGGAQ